MKRFTLTIVSILFALSVFAQYPKKLTWDKISVGDGIFFTIKAEIAEPSYGMHYVTYKFTNQSSSNLWLYWTTTLVLDNGSRINREHDWKFKAGQIEGMGWAHTESDVIDIKERGGKIINVLINSIRAEIEQQNESTEAERKQREEEENRVKAAEDQRLKQEQEKNEKEKQLKENLEIYQNQLQKNVNNGNDMIDKVSSFASEEVEDGELKGEFVFFGAYGFYGLTDINGLTNRQIESSGNSYSLGAELYFQKVNKKYSYSMGFWKLKGAYTVATAITLDNSTPDVMDATVYEFGVGWDGRGDDFSMLFELEYKYFNLSNYESVRKDYSQGNVALGISPCYAIGMDDKSGGMRIGGDLRFLFNPDEIKSEIGVGLGAFLEAKFNMLNLKISYSTLSFSSPEVGNRLIDGYLFNVFMGVRLPW
ncbi:MAG: hypothetical protein KF775_10020 [Cyclobacteriaceae bacterium]|nr:hypothetical protein [Cyclobacteriaceae bacterium]